MKHLYMAESRLYIIIALLIGATFTAIVIPLIVAFCRKFGYFDHPNQRKLHHVAIPRLGGLAFLPSMAMGGIITLLIYYANTVKTPDFHAVAVRVLPFSVSV